MCMSCHTRHLVPRACKSKNASPRILLCEKYPSFWGMRLAQPRRSPMKTTSVQEEGRPMTESSLIHDWSPPPINVARVRENAWPGDWEGPAPPSLSQPRRGKRKWDWMLWEIIKSTFLSANRRRRLFTKEVTRLPSAIALLTCEWRALQRFAHQNPAWSHTCRDYMTH